MFHSAAVDVSLLWDEVQSGRLFEGTIFVGEGNAGAHSFCELLFVFGPGDIDGSRIETGHMTNQNVLDSELHI